MSEAKAKEFIEKFYNDDEFLVDVLKKNEDVFRDQDGEAQTFKAFVIAGKSVGYDFTEEEGTAAQKAYFDSIGTWGAIKKTIHFARVAKKNGLGQK